MTYHYKESGLDNIYLENGYTLHETPYGEGVSIEDTAGLHKVIGKWIIETPKPVNGAELRFIRTEMELTQRDLAAILGTTEQTLRLWEKHRKKAVQGPADRLLRILFSEYLGGNGSIRHLVERLADLDLVQPHRACLRETNEGWRIAA